MSKTRLSLYYLASYLLAGGLGFLVFPQTSLSLLFASGVYSDLMVRMVGTLLIGIGIVVVQIIRLGARELYGTTIILRVMFLSIFTSFYFVYKDRSCWCCWASLDLVSF